jgi:ribosomal protein S14
VVRLPSPKDGITMTATTVQQERTFLRHANRCDTCGARAFIRALFVNGELMFCGHHGRLISIPLQQQAIFVEDGTDLINTPSTRAISD